MGQKVGIVDLTRGELGTRGSAEIRDLEAAVATKVLGVHYRHNLRLRDGFFEKTKHRYWPSFSRSGFVGRK